MFVGIDVAKAKFDVCVTDGAAYQALETFANTPAGHHALHTWLGAQAAHRAPVCMEATGTYHEELAYFLAAHEYPVSVINPLQSKAYEESRLCRNRTDTQAARHLADFCAERHPAVWQPLTPAERRLQALTRHYATLQQTSQRQQNRLESTHDELVRASLQRVRAQIQAEMATVQTHIDAHIAQTPELQHQHALLVSIPGVGAATAARLLGEMPHLAQYPSAKQAAAAAGLTPSRHTSGSSVRHQARLSTLGNRRVRRILYFPALTAIRYNPAVRQLHERLRAAGKAKMVVVGAAMRKLLHQAYGVLKNDCPFNPQYAH